MRGLAGENAMKVRSQGHVDLTCCGSSETAKEMIIGGGGVTMAGFSFQVNGLTRFDNVLQTLQHWLARWSIG
jgi:hypothetical protein